MANPKSEEARLRNKNPFDGLLISDNSILNTIDSRYPCQKCYKSRKFFCYTCYCPHPAISDVIPSVSLPVKIDIIKHKQEIDGKSTSAHAAILAPRDVTVYNYPDIPSYDTESVVLIFPTHTAIEIRQLFEADARNINEIKSNFDIKYPKGHNKGTLLKSIPDLAQNSNAYRSMSNVSELPIKRAVFIDSTWNQSKGIYKDERIKKLPCVVLQNRISQFWRHQKGSPRWYLATVEAIHQFLLELHINAWGVNAAYNGLKCCFTEKSLQHYRELVSDNANSYLGQYDNLLYFFNHMYKLIHDYYDHDNLHAYKRRMT